MVMWPGVGVFIVVVLQKGWNWRPICGQLGGRGWGGDLVWMLRGRLGFIFIAPTHPGTTMGSSTTSVLQALDGGAEEEMEEIGRNGSTKYNIGSNGSTKYNIGRNGNTKYNTGISYHFVEVAQKLPLET